MFSSAEGGLIENHWIILLRHTKTDLMFHYEFCLNREVKENSEKREEKQAEAKSGGPPNSLGHQIKHGHICRATGGRQ